MKAGSGYPSSSRFRLRPSHAFAALAAVLVPGGETCATDRDPDFSREILPILSDNCFHCHGPDASHRKAKLRLDEEADAKAPRKGYFIIKPGDSDESELISRINSSFDDELMPPADSNKRLSPHQKDLLTRWVASGARWGRHWSFTPLTRPEVSLDGRSSPAGHAVDAFVRQHLAAIGLAPAAEASRTALIRRVTLDLTGLPPTPAEVAEFLADREAGAFERVVDRLLASPAYGERMAWDWLELARYADTNGYRGDLTRTMWPWRDWVVKAFNENLAYDQFTVWQLAGDLLPHATTEQILATAFLRNHAINGEAGRIAEENRIDYVLDMTETTSTAWLGLTLGCARCHDHKFDPVTQRDYYAFSAFFNGTPVDGSGGDPQTKPVLDLSTAAQRAELAACEDRLAPLQAAVDELELAVFPRPPGEPASKSPAALGFNGEILGALDKAAHTRSAEKLLALAEAIEGAQPAYAAAVRRLHAAVAARDKLLGAMVRVMIMADAPKPRPAHVLDRGLYNRPLAEVAPGVPVFLPGLSSGAPANRLDLARWLFSAENPLTARVTVNRIWQMFFGVGLVKTVEDFGVQSEVPLHADLLDWLAADFRDSGWDMKHLVRTIVTSATYRQDNRLTPELLDRDPENRHLARGPRFRLPSWMIRDQALAASGLLVRTMGGPGVFPYQPPGIWEESSFGKLHYQADTGESLYRRSLYTFWRRSVGPTVFFDTPARFVCSVKPTRTNIPLHALATLNDPTYVEAARVLAGHALAAGTLPGDRLHFVFQRLLSRSPSATEAGILLAGLARHEAAFAASPEDARALLNVGDWRAALSTDPAEHAAWAMLCLAVLNLDETLTKS